MAQLTEVRRALAAAVSPLAPEVKVAAGGIQYPGSTRQFIVRVLVGEPSDEAEAALDELLALEGESSVRDALEQDQQLGGLVNSVYVARDSGHRLYQFAGLTPQLGAEWTVDVL